MGLEAVFMMAFECGCGCGEEGMPGWKTSLFLKKLVNGREIL